MRAVLLLTVLMGLTGCDNLGISKEGKPTTGKEAEKATAAKPQPQEDWTMRELMAHVNKTVKCKWREAGTNMIEIEFPKKAEKVDPESPFENTIKPDGYYSDYAYNALSDRRSGSIPHDVFIRKSQTNIDAIESAGSTRDGQSWGRFVIKGKPQYVQQVMAALPK
jgi:hypothetical protein